MRQLELHDAQLRRRGAGDAGARAAGSKRSSARARGSGLRGCGSQIAGDDSDPLLAGLSAQRQVAVHHLEKAR
jgi:hypothetical protein